MVQHSTVPASAPPAAPARETTGRLLLRAWVIVVLICVFGHAGLFNLVGMTGSVIAIAVVTLTTLAIWIPAISRAQPWPLEWRRLPWAIFGYVALGVLSLIWSRWPLGTVVTGALLVSLTLHAIFIAHMLSWREILRAIASALKWLLGLSLAVELWVALVLRHPILPNFFDAPAGEINAHWYWVRGNLLDGGRIQGIVGNANILAALCLIAIIVFGVLFAAGVRWRTTLALWGLVAAFLMIRASSATMFAAAALVGVTVVVALLMRRAAAPRGRSIIYVVALGTAAVCAALAVVFRTPLLEFIGRTTDMTGRLGIWQQVLERAAQRPVLGNGFSSPWVPSEPEIHGWIVDHGITVFHAHNMWVDVFFQLGIVGVAFMAFIIVTLLWRTWFFAVDRPRWDLRADRPYSPLTLAPSLIAVVLVVQGLTESAPIMLWGWLLAVLLSFKIKSVPLLGIGLSERSRVIERGEQPTKRVP